MVKRAKVYRVSVYGEVMTRKGGYVKPHWRAGSRVKGYTRKATYEQRRWDLRSGDKKKLQESVQKIRREKLAPRQRHQKVTADRFLRDWQKLMDKRVLRRERAES